MVQVVVKIFDRQVTFRVAQYIETYQTALMQHLHPPKPVQQVAVAEKVMVSGAVCQRSTAF